MHLDYRCYIKFRDPSLWRKALAALEIEDTNGQIHTFLEIGEMFREVSKLFEKLTDHDPMADIFDTTTMSEEEAFYFVHDHRKPYAFFEGLTNYMFCTLLNEIGENFVLIADVTNYDDDSMGNYILYYLGETDAALHQFVVDGPDGLDHHDNNIADIDTMLADAPITEQQKNSMRAIVGDVFPDKLMNNHKYEIFPENFDFDVDGDFDEEELDDDEGLRQ